MARAGLRRGELCGLRRSDVHLLADSRPLGCEVARAHLHVVRREDNPNGAWAKSRRQRAVPLDFLVVQAFDTYELERMSRPGRGRQRLRAGEPVPRAGRRAGAPGRDRRSACRRVPPGGPGPRRSRRISCGTPSGATLADAGCGIDVVADLLGHASVSSSQVYMHPDPAGCGPPSTRCPALASRRG